MTQLKNKQPKPNILFAIGLPMLFILLGIYLINDVSTQSTNINSNIIKGVGIVTILFFGSLFILSVSKLIKMFKNG